ncbi:MAG: DUF3147 family protein [Steroidobacteraceae bacterium]
MIPAVDPSSLKDAHWTQFAARFVLGGAVTACTGLVAQHWGPVIGGLFLAFPAIFPATATLIERQGTAKKRKAGIECRVRGRKAAALDAAGAVLGGCGLACFGCVAWLLLPEHSAALALGAAGAAWLFVAISLWWVRQHA